MSKIFRSHKVSFHSRRTLSRPLVMSPPETTALLPSVVENGTDRSDPTWIESYRWFLFSSYFNVFLVFVPLSALAHHLNWDVSLRFILSNILLVLGCSFLAAGIKRPESHFGVTAAQASSSLMTLACITLVIPAAYYSTQTGDNAGLLIISRGTALVLLFVYCAYIFFQLKTHVELYSPGNEEAIEEEEPKMSVVAAASSLLAVTVVTSFCADYLVASIEEFAERYSVPKPFIGLILLPIVANAAEHVTSIWMAMKNRMELTITICVGSSIQIATFVVPLLVIIGWISGHGLTLFFANFETIVLFVSVVLVNTLIQDGKSNYMEGLMLLSLYFVIALAFWVT